MKRLTSIGVVLLVACGGLWAQELPPSRLICGFDKQADLARIEFMGEGALVTDAKVVTQGAAALKLSVTAVKGARGIEITGTRLKGWEKYRWALVDVHNLGDRPSPIAVRFDDARSRNYQTRCTTEGEVIRPGTNTIRIPLEALKRQNGDAFDVSTLSRVVVYVWQPKHDFDMVIDNLRLEGPLAPEAIVKAAPPKLVCGFEDETDLARVEITGTKTFVDDAKHVMQGKSALKLSVKGGEGSIIVELIGDRLKGWDKYEAVAFDVYNLTQRRLPLGVRLDDAESTDYQTRCTLEDLALRPGANTIRVKLDDLVRQNGDALDVSTLKRLVVFIWKPEEDTDVVIDNLRLTGGTVVTAKRTRGKGPRLVTGFEDADDIRKMEFEGSEASLTMQPERVTEGKSALAVTFSKTSPWPGFRIVEPRLLSGWTGYDQLTMDVFNLSEKKLTITFRFDDAKTNRYEMRAHATALLQPGKNTTVVLLKALRRENGQPFDLSSLKAVVPHLGRNTEDVHLIFDNWQLRVDAGATIDIPNAHLFDFGGDATVTFPGFVKVTNKTRFSAAKGYGFVSTRGLSGSGRAMPDDLAGDYVAAKDLRFRVKVPNGKYIVYTSVADVTEGYALRIGSGDSFVDIAQTPPKPWSTDGLYRDINEDHYPGKDLWQVYIAPEHPTRNDLIIVRNGQIDVTGNAKLSSLVVCPIAQVDKMKPIRAKILKDRKAQFTRDYCTIEIPKSRAPEPTPTPAQTASGMIVFTPHRMKTVYPTTRPTTRTTRTGLTLSAAKAQREQATFAVYPLRKFNRCNAVVSDLTGPADAVISAANVDVRLTRYMERPAGGGTYTPKPTQLVKRATTLYPKFTRQYWVIVDVPADATPGTYRGTVSLEGTTVKVPVRLEVYPFTLPTKSGCTFAFYCSKPFGAGKLAGSGRTFEQALEAEIIDMKQHGLNSMQVPLPGMRGVANDRIRLDWKELEIYVKLMKKHGLCADNPVMWYALSFGRFLMRRAGPEYSPRFNRILKNTIAEADKWWKDRGFEMLWWVVDEPREQAINPWNRNLDGTMKYLKLYREVPGVKTSVTPMGDSSHGVDYTPMIPMQDIIQTHPWARSAKSIAEAQKPGPPILWFYNAGTDRLSYGMYVWKMKATGRWQWHYQWPDTSWHPFRGRHWAAVYPSPDGPVPTVAYEHVAMGIIDYKYIELLERTIAEAKRKRIPARSAEKLLEEIETGIPQWPVKGLADGTDVGSAYEGGVNAQLDVWRNKLAKEIITLNAALKR